MIAAASYPTSVENPARPPAILQADPAVFRENFNKRTFMFRHALAGNPLFELRRLAEVAERMLAQGESQKFVALGARANAVDSKISEMPPREKLAATIRDLPESGSWVKITSAELFDAEYAEMQRQILAELEELSGYELRREITWSCMTLFLTSPGMITPYHIDHESNFLFQVSGEKEFIVYPPEDRKVLSVEEIERFYAGDFQAARYSEAKEPLGVVNHLVAGTVAHNPSLGPHWVRNSDMPSVSISIGLCLRPLDRRGLVHQVNHYLRRLGVTPTPQGRSAVMDWLKASCMQLPSKSNPKTPDEILFSGITRLMEPRRALKRLLGTRKDAPPAV